MINRTQAFLLFSYLFGKYKSVNAVTKNKKTKNKTFSSIQLIIWLGLLQSELSK